jgi:peptide deformylase
MAFRKILKFPDPALRQKSQAVKDFDSSLPMLVSDLYDTLNVTGGVGLSAPQIGTHRRVIYVRTEQFSDAMVNPLIINQFQPEKMPEGCLSFPGINENVQRNAHIEVKYQDILGNNHSVDLTGLAAQVVQHEIEHLDGILMVDHLHRIIRARVKKKVNRIKKEVQSKMSSEAPSITRIKEKAHLSKKERNNRRRRRRQNR